MLFFYFILKIWFEKNIWNYFFSEVLFINNNIFWHSWRTLLLTLNCQLSIHWLIHSLTLCWLHWRIPLLIVCRQNLLTVYQQLQIQPCGLLTQQWPACRQQQWRQQDTLLTGSAGRWGERRPSYSGSALR